MSSTGPPPAAPTFEASKCALIMARAVASVIESPSWYGRGPVPRAAVEPRRAQAPRDPTPTRPRCKLVLDVPICERTTVPASVAGRRDGTLTGAGPACALDERNQHDPGHAGERRRDGGARSFASVSTRAARAWGLPRWRSSPVPRTSATVERGFLTASGH